MVYVDDIVITGSNTTLIANFIQALADRFSLKDPTDLQYFLGIEGTRTSQGLHFMQRKYIMDFLVNTNMVAAKPVLTPLLLLRRVSLCMMGHRNFNSQLSTKWLLAAYSI